MQIVSKSHKLSKPVFSENKKKYFDMSSAENFTQSAKLQDSSDCNYAFFFSFFFQILNHPPTVKISVGFTVK